MKRFRRNLYKAIFLYFDAKNPILNFRAIIFNYLENIYRVTRIYQSYYRHDNVTIYYYVYKLGGDRK